jgi:hypothetical protein
MNSAYAASVGHQAGLLVKDLPLRSKVTLRTLGDYDPTKQALIRLDWVISLNNTAEDVARTVEDVTAGIPALVARRTLKPQMTTNILGFLENTAQIADCRAYPTTVALISDGIEDSGYARLNTVKGELPLPKTRIFDHCDKLEILGLGRGSRNPALTSHLREQWNAWAQAAGFRSFLGLGDW